MMHYRQLGSSSQKVSEISFGCMSLSGTDKDNQALLSQAIDSGINLFDTADLYDKGRNEETVGKALKEQRKKIFISTKVGNQWRPDGSGWDWNPRKEYILSSVEESLRRLQTDYIDLYQLHGGTMEDPIDETIEAFETLNKQGKIRYYGISSIRPKVIREYIHRSSIVSVMMQYSLIDRRPEEECLQLLQQHGIGVLARGALAKGILVNKPPTDFLGLTVEQVNQARVSVAQVSKTERTPAQTALRFVLSNPAISSAVVGIRTLSQLSEMVAAASTPPLSADELALLQHATPVLSYG